MPLVKSTTQHCKIITLCMHITYSWPMHAQLKFSELVTKSIGAKLPAEAKPKFTKTQMMQRSLRCGQKVFNSRFICDNTHSTFISWYKLPNICTFVVFIFWCGWICAKFNPDMVFIDTVILVNWAGRHKRCSKN